MTVVTAATVQNGVLEPALDATAVALGIEELLDRPHTPEADSVCELLVEQMRVTLELARLVGRVAQANGVVLDLDRQINGWADQIVTALRHEERNGPGKVMTGKQVAVELIPIIDLHLEGHPDAAERIFRLVRHIPEQVLLRDAVTYHLGKRRTQALNALIDTWRTR